MNDLLNIRDESLDTTSRQAETIGEKLDRLSPHRCDICDTPMQRTDMQWPFCQKCGHDQTGPEAYLIMRVRAASHLSNSATTTAPLSTKQN